MAARRWPNDISSDNVTVTLFVPPLTYKINAHNMSGVSSWAVILTEGL